MSRYIDQDKVIDAVLELDTTHRVSWQDAVIDMIDTMPSEDVQPVVHGEWVGVHAYCDHLNEEAKVNGRPERYLPSGMVIGVYCNQCWCRVDKKSDFCPNCGRKMGKRKEIDCTDCIKNGGDWECDHIHCHKGVG